jgi:ABC-type transporter Mla subunit MlaD
MIPRVLALLAVLAVAAVLLFGGSDKHHYKVPLTNAVGLKDGGAVRIGGENRGKLELRLTSDDQVFADLSLDQRIGKDADVQVVSANFLGTKRIEIDPGDFQNNPAPENYTLPADRVSLPTDLDQVLGVFDADTRARMRILLNEAGAAVMNRDVDISTLFEQFPIGLEDASQILADISADNATMRALVERSDRFVAEAAAERKELGRLIDVLGSASATVAAKRTQLRETLARAPHALQTLQAFSRDLLETTTDLGPAAREIAATAPALSATLAQVDGVREAAEPTLNTAVDVAPDLSRLAVGATPTLRRAQPTIRSLAVLGEHLPPVTDALNGSFDNTVGILENWSRAIQFRDELSHVFRGEASYSPDFVVGAVDRLLAQSRKNKPHKQRPARRRRPPAQTAPVPPGVPAPPVKPSKPVQDIIDRLPKLPVLPQLPQVLDNTTGLLDYLLKP